MKATPGPAPPPPPPVEKRESGAAGHFRRPETGFYSERFPLSLSKIQMEYVRKAAGNGKTLSDVIRDCINRRFGLDGRESNARFNPDQKL